MSIRSIARYIRRERHTTARSALHSVRIMLQKLFSSASRLRLLLLACQAIGLFPFAWSSHEPDAVQFSIPLFLWSLALHVVQMIQLFILPISFSSSLSNTVASTAILLSYLTLFLGCFLSHLVQFCKGSTLADLLPTLTLKHRNTFRKISVSSSLGQVAFAVVTLASCIICVKNMIIVPDENTKIMCFVTFLTLLRNALIVLLYGEILMVLADELEWNTEVHAKQLSLSSSSDVAVVLPNQILEQQLVCLQRLERQIRDVSR